MTTLHDVAPAVIQDALSGPDGKPLAPSVAMGGPMGLELLERVQDGSWDVKLIVPGDPIPWAPKQVNRSTGSRFVPARQSNAIGRIMDAFQRAGDGFWAPKDTPLYLSCSFYIERPKGHYGTGRNAGVIKDRFERAWPTGRPDLSNLVKLVEDALTKLAWADDDQVVAIERPVKLYAERPRTEIRIKVLGG